MAANPFLILLKTPFRIDPPKDFWGLRIDFASPVSHFSSNLGHL
jgi:hypothetical protein